MGRPIRLSENQLFAVLAVLVGIGGGLSAVGFHHLIDLLVHDVFGRLNESVEGLGRASVVPALVIGALLVGPMVTRWASEAKGHGVPEVIEAVAIRSGRIRARVPVVKAVASAITISSGGSAGREGPIVQIGSAIGSIITRPFKMSDRRRRTYVAAGAAAGIAAIFNAPLAGVFFALEVILRSFTARGFSTVVISAVTANAVWRVLVSDDPVLTSEVYRLEEPIELVFYGLLGIAAAVVALVFVRILYIIEDWFEESPIRPELRPVVGALVVGGIGIASVDLLGAGLEGIDKALAGEFATATLLLLILGKILATSFTLGSGGSGGVFSPSLLIGALLGATFGDIITELFPDSSAPAGAYAVVGMAAVFAAAAQAPMSSIFIVFEMTSDFGLIMPLMLACAASTVVYTAVNPNSIYMEKIRRRHVHIEDKPDEQEMSVIPLARAAEAKYLSMFRTRTTADAVRLMKESREDFALVVAPDRSFKGVVWLDDLEEAGTGGSKQLIDVMDDEYPVGYPDHSLADGMAQFESGVVMLPIVDWNDRLLGVASAQSVVRAYEASRGSTFGGETGDSPVS
ncbi:MAG: chloride channel protein [Actinomycetia bacterium]|nr:chloride channel protein [Actinomycetes bacterium]MCP4959539.1 chloride channel protein [Actinomycetes bacterium]